MDTKVGGIEETNAANRTQRFAAKSKERIASLIASCPSVLCPRLRASRAGCTFSVTLGLLNTL